MLRMIIADDEFIVRDGLKTSIPWEKYGVEVIAEAVDGQEAFDLCEKLHPDILFTDIRMPSMDGLEVAMKLKEHGNEAKIIIISGVQDFNYAKTALDINAEGYILKPVKQNELIEVIKKVVNKVTMERNKEWNLQQLKHQLRENLSFMRDKFLNTLISGLSIDEKELADKLAYYEIHIKSNENKLAAAVQIDDYKRRTENLTEEEKHLICFTVRNIIEEVIDTYNAGVSFNTAENEFAVIFNESAQLNDKYNDICKDIIDFVSKFTEVTVSVGIGSSVDNLLNISQSYNEAVVALSYKFYTGISSVLNIYDVNSILQSCYQEDTSTYSSTYVSENKLIASMKLGDTIEVSKTIKEIFNTLTSGKKPPVEYVQNICVELISIASRALFELDETFDRIIKNRSEIQEHIFGMENIFDLEEYLTGIFNKTTSYFSSKYTQKNTKLIEKIKEIINERYMENLEVAAISEEVYLTPNYISLLFKHETGETITEYITKIRMEKAKNLLKSSDMKILEIAEAVGYDNPRYFSTVFRKYTGITPQQFRSYTS